MEVKRGKGFFEAKIAPLLNAFAKDLFDAGMPINVDLSKGDVDVREISRFKLIGFGCETRRQSGQWFPCARYCRTGDSERSFEISNGDIFIMSAESDLTHDEGLADLQVRVRGKDQIHRSKAMKISKKFAHAWEAKAKQLKGSRLAKVTIFQDFA